MKKIFTNTRLLLLLALIGFSAFTGCKVGEDDPAISLKSRENRVSNFWTLVETRTNGSTEEKNGDVTWDIRESGTITQKVEGTVFGFETQSTTSGIWEFRNDEGDLFVNFDGETYLYEIDRLSSEDLWLSLTDNNNLYELIFENR